MLRLFLKKGRELPVLRGHPWVFSGAIDRSHGDTVAVSVAEIFDYRSQWIARGFYSPASQIRVRVLTLKDEAIDRDFFSARVKHAMKARLEYLPRATSAYRLINSEGDFVPGLIVDRYGDFLVCQFLTAGVGAFKPEIVQSLLDLVRPRGIFERSEGRGRDEEGLEPAVGVLAGEPPPELITFQENGFEFVADVRRGQKTGFFLDQRDNRSFLAALSAHGSVLNCFSYSGAFSVYAYGGRATHVLSLDSSASALTLARRNLQLNGFIADDASFIKADAFTYLKENDSMFDVIILDPPSLAHKRSDVEAATGGYKFLNLHAFRRLRPGGLLLTFSCSHHLSAELFQKVVFGAAVDAPRTVTILKKLGHPIDHPVSLHHPEGEYLKGLALRVLD